MIFQLLWHLIPTKSCPFLLVLNSDIRRVPVGSLSLSVMESGVRWYPLPCWHWMTERIQGGTHICAQRDVLFPPLSHIPLMLVRISPMASPSDKHGQRNIPSRWGLLLLLLSDSAFTPGTLQCKSSSDTHRSLPAFFGSFDQLPFYSPVSFVTPCVLKCVPFTASEGLCRGLTYGWEKHFTITFWK